MRCEVGIEDSEFQIEDGGLWIEDRNPILDNLIMPHQDLIHIFLFNSCCESHYFEDIV